MSICKEDKDFPSFLHTAYINELNVVQVKQISCKLEIFNGTNHYLDDKFYSYFLLYSNKEKCSIKYNYTN